MPTKGYTYECMHVVFVCVFMLHPHKQRQQYVRSNHTYVCAACATEALGLPTDRSCTAAESDRERDCLGKKPATRTSSMHSRIGQADRQTSLHISLADSNSFSHTHTHRQNNDTRSRAVRCTCACACVSACVCVCHHHPAISLPPASHSPMNDALHPSIHPSRHSRIHAKMNCSRPFCYEYKKEREREREKGSLCRKKKRQEPLCLAGSLRDICLRDRPSCLCVSICVWGV